MLQKQNRRQSLPQRVYTVCFLQEELGGLLAVNCFEDKKNKKKASAKYCCPHESTHTPQNSLLTIYTMTKIVILSNKLDASLSVAQEQQAASSVTVCANNSSQATLCEG